MECHAGRLSSKLGPLKMGQQAQRIVAFEQASSRGKQLNYTRSKGTGWASGIYACSFSRKLLVVEVDRARSKIIKRWKQTVEEIEITTVTRGPGLGHAMP